MIKKIALAAALAATASFATWDKFPVLEANKGQAKVGVDYMMQDKVSGLDAKVGARYSVIQNLELGLSLPYRIFTDWDGEDGADGLENLTFMARYQFMPIMNAFLDVEFPIGEEELVDDGFGFHFGVQYSQGFGMVTLGSEAGLTITTEGDDEVSGPWDLNVGVEGDFNVNEMFTPYVGIDVDMWLGETTHDGDEVPDNFDESGTLGLMPYVGVGIAINPMFSVDLCASFGLGDDYYGKDLLTIISASLFINF